jgi:pimeloyl-ACP methyl ester carboxylesterase
MERAEVRPGVELAFWRVMSARPPGFPVLLVHGWPETKRIWARNAEPLAAAGFEVVVPDLRGFGDSGLASDGFYDLAAHARDLYALVHDVLGHERCAASGGDRGGGVIQDLALRFEGFVARQVLFNCVLPILPEAY